MTSVTFIYKLMLITFGALFLTACPGRQNATTGHVSGAGVWGHDNPSHCEYSSYSKEPACFATGPSYCEYSAYSKEPACVASGPKYCEYSAYSGEPSCFAAKPAYCAYSAYSKELSCIASNPPYCEYSAYSKEPACYGSKPSYCQYSAYANEPSCRNYYGNNLALYCRYYDTAKLCPSFPVQNQPHYTHGR